MKPQSKHISSRPEEAENKPSKTVGSHHLKLAPEGPGTQSDVLWLYPLQGSLCQQAPISFRSGLNAPTGGSRWAVLRTSVLIPVLHLGLFSIYYLFSDRVFLHPWRESHPPTGCRCRHFNEQATRQLFSQNSVPHRSGGCCSRNGFRSFFFFFVVVDRKGLAFVLDGMPVIWRKKEG